MSASQSNINADIVVIDRDSNFCAELARFLKSEGRNPVAFDNADQCLRFMKNMPWSWMPKLVITDIVLDGMGGFQLMRSINELYPDKTIPMIVISELYSADYVYEAEVAGASTFLQKPLEVEKLKEAIHKASQSSSELVF